MTDVKLSDSDKNVNIRMEKRDGETYVALGLFILAVSLPVILGTYWAYAPGTTVSIVVSRGPTASVPDVTGQVKGQAEKALESAGLVLGNVAEAFSATVPAASVISQDPAAGASAEPNAEVSLVISRGPAFSVKVPRVIKQPQELAQQRVEYEELVIGDISEDFSPSIPRGSIISQDPVGGASVLSGSKVNLVVSKGPDIVRTPSIAQQPLAQARATIEEAGLLLGPVAEAFSSTISAGSVIGQNPIAGDPIALGAAVQLVISKGTGKPGISSVPPVAAQTETQARKAIEEAGLKVGSVKESFSSTVPAGNVISQDPAAGSYLEPHFRAATVNIVCAGGLLLIGVAAIAYGRVLLARHKRRA
jgi:beta-lactam-binding protein with PASTA domain